MLWNRASCFVVWILIIGSSLLGWATANADESKNNQVIFRGAYSRLTDSRGGEVFTDTNGATVLNDNQGGYSVAAGVDLSLLQVEALGGANLMGEIFMELSRFSRKTVTQATSVLLGGAATSNVAVTELNCSVSPKLRFDGLGAGIVRPFIVPVGLAFLVNSPPSDDTTYLDLGLQFAAGVDFKLVGPLSAGVDFRYTYSFEQSNTNTRYFSTGGYVGINF